MTILAIADRHRGRVVVTGVDATKSEGTAAAQRASAIVVAMLGLLVATKIADATGNVGWRLVPFVAALFVLPFLYVMPVTRHLWTNHRYWLLGIQAVLTYAPFGVFGANWTTGVTGLLGGLVLLTVAAPFSWLLFGTLIAVEGVIRIGLVGLPAHVGRSAFVFVLVAYVDEGLALFGLARLADLVARVHAAREELADLAIGRERLRAAETMRSAVGERLTAVSDRIEAALRAMDHGQEQARELIAEAGVVTRQALARVRGRNGDYLSCAVADGLAIIALQLRHSRPSGRGGHPPAAWPWTLALQALLVCGMIPALGWIVIDFCGFIAGSALLLIPGRRGHAAFAAVIVSVLGLALAWLPAGLTLSQQISTVVYDLAATAFTGLLVYGLSRLAGLAVRLEGLHGELARAATLQERVRVARDTHDLLGLGMTAVALKADLITRLIGRDDARARIEITEMHRICTAAIADMRLVTDGGGQLCLASELAQARSVLLSGGVALSADITGEPRPAAADAVLATVLREAITNILRHSTATQCTITATASDGMLRLRVSNDGAAVPVASNGSPGQGLANATARVCAAGGHLTSKNAGGWFDLIAEIPMSHAKLGAVTRPRRGQDQKLQPSGVGGDAHRIHPVACAELGHR